jgi:hypothetical protein
LSPVDFIYLFIFFGFENFWFTNFLKCDILYKKEGIMKKIKNTNFLNTIPLSGTMIYDKDISEQVKKDYKTKNLNELSREEKILAMIFGKNG